MIWRDSGTNRISAPAFVPHLIGDDWKAPELVTESHQYKRGALSSGALSNRVQSAVIASIKK